MLLLQHPHTLPQPQAPAGSQGTDITAGPTATRPGTPPHAAPRIPAPDPKGRSIPRPRAMGVWLLGSGSEEGTRTRAAFGASTPRVRGPAASAALRPRCQSNAPWPPPQHHTEGLCHGWGHRIPQPPPAIPHSPGTEPGVSPQPPPHGISIPAPSSAVPMGAGGCPCSSQRCSEPGPRVFCRRSGGREGDKALGTQPREGPPQEVGISMQSHAPAHYCGDSTQARGAY